MFNAIEGCEGGSGVELRTEIRLLPLFVSHVTPTTIPGTGTGINQYLVRRYVVYRVQGTDGQSVTGTDRNKIEKNVTRCLVKNDVKRKE